jgi:4-diphosphocytidyl-2-C-methyl-D-erythritol kinase
LGGGSSDAAAVLKMLEGVLHLPGGERGLREMAVELGADVAFFAADLPLAIGRGRGERLWAGPGLEPRPMLIAFPGISISTAEAYTAWDEAHERGAISSARPAAISSRELSDWNELVALAINDFEPVILDRFPELASIKQKLQASGASIAMLSGSGSALFAVYESEARRRDALSYMSEELKGVRLVSARGPV